VGCTIGSFFRKDDEGKRLMKKESPQLYREPRKKERKENKGTQCSNIATGKAGKRRAATTQLVDRRDHRGKGRGRPAPTLSASRLESKERKKKTIKEGKIIRERKHLPAKASPMMVRRQAEPSKFKK